MQHTIHDAPQGPDPCVCIRNARGKQKGRRIVEIEAFRSDSDSIVTGQHHSDPVQHHSDWPVSLQWNSLPELACLNMLFYQR